MKKLFFVLVYLFLFQTVTYSESVTIPVGTVIPLAYSCEVTSRKVLPDEKIPVYVVRDVLINNRVVFPRGAQGYVTVFDAKKVQTWSLTQWDKGGFIEIDGGAVQDVYGNMRQINYQDYHRGADARKGSMAACFSNGNVNSPYNYTNNQTFNSNSYAFGGTSYSQNASIRKDTRFRGVTANEFELNYADEI